MKSTQVIAVLALVAAAGVGGWYVGQRGDAPGAAAVDSAAAVEQPAEAPDPLDWRKRIKYEDVLPDFAEPTDGQRAPTNAAFGLLVGKTTLDEARRFVADRGLTCTDTSVRALMANYRDKKVAEIEQAKAAGDADGASGASWLWRSTKHEKNPQVRLTCEKARFSAIGDRPRDEQTIGRLLLIFDSKDLPLRHVTVQALFADDDHASARAAFIDADEAMRRLLGEPAITRNAPPAEGGEFPRMQSLRREWRFADLEAKVSALRLKTGVTVYEEIGVPWPVRPDAPVMGQAGK